MMSLNRIVILKFALMASFWGISLVEAQAQANSDIKPSFIELDESFKIFKKDPQGTIEQRKELISKWSPSNPVQSHYKDYFLADLMGDKKMSVQNYWALYKDLKKTKRLMRLQLESLDRILALINTDAKDEKPPFTDSELKKEVKATLKRFRGLPEGLDLELKYLKWIVKHEVKDELCKAERNRWLSQAQIALKEVSEGLKSCPMDYDDFIYRIRLLVFSGYEKQAETEIEEFVSTQPLMAWEKAYLKAIYFANIGDPVSAFEMIKAHEEDVLKSEDYRDNLFFIAQRAGQLAKAEELINKLILSEKVAKDKKEFTFYKAFLFYQTKRYGEAIPILDQLIQNHSSRRKKRKSNDYDDLTWLRAWCYYLNKDYAKAQEAFLNNRDWTRDKSRNLYWLAQTEWKMGNQMKALSYFRQLAAPLLEGQFFNYYNYLAWIRFETNKQLATNEAMKNQMSVLKSGRGVFMIPDGDANTQQLLAEYKSYFEEISVTDEGDIQVMNQDALVASQSETEAISIETSSQLKLEMNWADRLIDWGFPELAKWHLFDVEKSFKTRRSAEPLIQYYLDRRLYYRALSLMQKLSSIQDKKISLKDDDMFWRSIYPKAYELNVKSEALIRRVDPYLIWSIMKAETQFKSDAISPVGAVGLMQFMPYTSIKVATLLKESNHNPRTLFQPEIAVQHGAMYLKKLGAEFNGQIPLMAAAYNGGPHRVKLWLRHLGEVDFDVFVEHIPFTETRTYVKRVLSFMKTYQRLYEDQKDYKKSQWLIDKNQFKISEPISLKEEWDVLK